MNEPQITIRTRLEQTGFKEAKTEAEQLVHATDEAQSSAERLVNATDDAGNAAERLVNSTDKAKNSAEEAAKEFEKIDKTTREMADRKLPITSSEEVNRLQAYRREVENIRVAMAEMAKSGRIPSVEEARSAQAYWDDMMNRRDKHGRLIPLSEDEKSEMQGAGKTLRDFEEFQDLSSRERQLTKLVSLIETAEGGEKQTDSASVMKMATIFLSRSGVGGPLAGLLSSSTMGALGAAAGAGLLVNMFSQFMERSTTTAAQFLRPATAWAAYSGGQDPLTSLGSPEDVYSGLGITPAARLNMTLQLARMMGPKASDHIESVVRFATMSGIDPNEAVQMSTALKHNYYGDLGSMLATMRGTSTQAGFDNRTALLASNYIGMLDSYASSHGVAPSEAQAHDMLRLYAGMASKGEYGVQHGAAYINQFGAAAENATGRAESFMLRAYMTQTDGPKDYMSFLRWKQNRSSGMMMALWAQAKREAGDLAPAVMQELGFISKIDQFDKLGEFTLGETSSVDLGSMQIPKNLEEYNRAEMMPVFKDLYAGVSSAGGRYSQIKKLIEKYGIGTNFAKVMLSGYQTASEQSLNLMKTVVPGMAPKQFIDVFGEEALSFEAFNEKFEKDTKFRDQIDSSASLHETYYGNSSTIPSKAMRKTAYEEYKRLGEAFGLFDESSFQKPQKVEVVITLDEELKNRGMSAKRRLPATED